MAIAPWYERVDGTPEIAVDQGDILRVRLRVVVPNAREFLVLDEPLPAGLEAVDASLRTTGRLGPFETPKRTSPTSYVARATTPGVFVRPPAHAEEMYNPALQGRSDGGRFVVAPR